MFAVTFTLVAVVFAIIYFYFKYVYSHWKRRGIPYLKPTIPFGNFSKTFMRKWPMCVQLTELYRGTSEPFVGIFILQSPFLLIRDPKLIRSILITDFQYFTDRKFYSNEKYEPLTGNLAALRGQRWRNMRSNLTPAFTSHKIKTIFSVLLDCGHQLQRHLFKVVETNEAIEMGEIIECYALNVISSIAFGIDVDCLANPNHPFRTALRQIFEINLKNSIRFIGWILQPTLLKWSGLRFMDRAVENYFLKLVAQTLEMRKQNDIVRKDFVQFLVELRNSDTNTLMDTDDEWKTMTEKSEQKSLSFEQIAAQAFSFVFAGVQGTSLVTSFCLYEIAKHPDIQQKLHTELDHVLAQHNGQLTFESIEELKYLDCCFNETLRKYQLLDLTRVCVKDYKMPGTNVTIEKGTSIIIPTFALHNDEKFYPDPKKFDPTRFYKENTAVESIDEMPYFPFGEGPRSCIGQRLGKMFVKIGICSILQQYHIDLDDRHIGKEIKLSIHLHPVGGTHLKFKIRK